MLRDLQCTEVHTSAYPCFAGLDPETCPEAGSCHIRTSHQALAYGLKNRHR